MSTWWAARWNFPHARGASKATVAVGHSILVAAYHILERRVPYADLGADYFLHRHDPERHPRALALEEAAARYRGIGVDRDEAECHREPEEYPAWEDRA